jgi:pimeloyl-ACP methyl ester carboxylesterase
MIQERRLETARGDFRCLEAGAGWPVVLLHAFPLTADMWRPQLEHVPSGWRYLAPDMRGFGGSPNGAHRPTMDDYAADVEAMLDALEIESAVIGGLSMGGYITFALHRRAPERFTRVILADTKAEADTPEGRENRRAMSALVCSDGVPAVADRMLPRLLGPRAGSDLVEAVRQIIEQNTADGLDCAIHAMMDRPDSTPDLPRIRVPMLVMVGEEDAFTPPADGERIQQATERSQLVVLPGVGHLSNLEAPEAFSVAVENFLASSM